MERRALCADVRIAVIGVKGSDIRSWARSRGFGNSERAGLILSRFGEDKGFLTEALAANHTSRDFGMEGARGGFEFQPMLAKTRTFESARNSFPHVAAHPGGVRSAELGSVVQEAIDCSNWLERNRRFVFHSESFQCDLLMSLLVYFYARGVYSSSDIEASLPEDETARDICAGSYPDWRTLRRFRRVYRDALKSCLGYVLDHYRPSVLGQETPVRHSRSTLPRFAIGQRTAGGGTSPLEPEAEAEERINRAVFIDGMSMVD